MSKRVHKDRYVTRRIARARGWFSIGLGAAETIAPRALCRSLDVDGDETLVQAGDAVDLGALGAAPTRSRRKAM
jgi:hypothetical protein